MKEFKDNHKTKKANEEYRRLFAGTIVAVQTLEEALAFIEDLFTPNESIINAQRVGLADQLIRGDSYKVIMRAAKEKGDTISTTTINRVNNTLNEGNGSLKLFIARAKGMLDL